MQQTTFPVEILIHDDASTDETSRIIKEYQSAHPQIIKPIFQTENQYSKGRNPNVNFNFPRARGRYIATCEGDDYWIDPRKLQTQVQFLDSNPEYVVCYHDACIVDSGGNPILDSKLPSHLKRDFTAEDLLMGAWTLTLTRCFRNLFSTFPETINNVLNADAFLSVMLGLHGKGKYLDSLQPAAYRRHSTSVWSSLPKDEQVFQNFNSSLYIYQYLMNTAGKETAIRYLFHRVFPFAWDVYPTKNPLRRRLHNSLSYRLGNALLWPLKRLFRFRGS